MEGWKVFFDIAFPVVGGLGIFLLGMKFMSDGMQNVAGSRLRKCINAVTNNRFLAVGIGTLVTCIIQSSSVTTVMVVGFVNSGFMTLAQAIGVIMGANIGTTITGWILVLKIGVYGLPIMGVAILFYRFSRREWIRFTAMAIMGVGMIFFGLELMKDGFKPIRSMPEFEQWFTYFNAGTYFGVLKCVSVGCILTFIVQSSSATLGITIGLAFTGIIPFTTAAALVLGENIGTTVTTFLASFGTTTNAKRAAYAHIVFNVIGVLWITAIFDFYLETIIPIFLTHDPMTLDPVDGSYPYITQGIATVHTVFNVVNTIIFLPFIPLLARFLERIIKEKPYKEAPHLTRLESVFLETPAMGIEQSRFEILRMGEIVEKMAGQLREILASDKPDEDLIKKIFHREEVCDIMQKEIVNFLTDIFSDSAGHTVAEEARQQLRITDEYESVSDYIANILKLHLRLQNEGLDFTEQGRKDMLVLHDRVAAYLKMVNEALRLQHVDVISKAAPQGDAITHKVRELRERHLLRVTEQKMEPLKTVVYTNMLNSYRRVKDHMFNIAEAMAGEK
ncbi:MAG: Na/Pi cotransporter family protein [Planctomycetes bacterium]|nr:Na/Pi cotransporter family protein [Planctomycetota bacterium]